MKWGMFIHADAFGAPWEGWLKDYDPDGGRTVYPTGSMTVTEDPAAAKQFDSASAVLQEWQRVSTTVPVRPDGKPNRPLTAFTIEPRQLP